MQTGCQNSCMADCDTNGAASCSYACANTCTYASFTLATLEANLDISAYYGDCDAGYICLEGATKSNPDSAADGGGYPCPVGYYCPSGSIIEQPCLPGTYQDAE